jgi:aspartate racemase
MTQRRTIGILGGMGPLATADLYRKIIEATPARRDQDHLHVVIEADPSVPDRTEALLGDGEDPLPALVRGTRRLADAGVDFIVMPCNTAHAFLPNMQAACPARFLSMIDETARVAATRLRPGAVVGILATRGTIAANLYQEALQRESLRAIVPDEADQELVSAAIARVKAGDVSAEAADLALRAANGLIARGAEAVLAACTELPVILRPGDLSALLIDPTEVLAHAAVREALAGDEDGQPARTGRKVGADAIRS